MPVGESANELPRVRGLHLLAPGDDAHEDIVVQVFSPERAAQLASQPAEQPGLMVAVEHIHGHRRGRGRGRGRPARRRSLHGKRGKRKSEIVIDNQYYYPSLRRSEEHTSELQSLMRISYAVFCLTKKKKIKERLT